MTSHPSGSFNARNWLDHTHDATWIDLSQPMQKGIPIHPAHPQFHITLNNRHGDVVRPCGHSSANEVMITSTHSSTHIDAICHVSDHGRLYGGIDAGETQAGPNLFKKYGVETIGPIFRRGVLLDIAGIRGVDALPPAYEITAADLDAGVAEAGVELAEGDVILMRTGWAQYWSDNARFLGLNSEGAPGPGVEGANWLARSKPFAVGTDTSAFEVMDKKNITMEVHLILIAQCGIHLIENLDLEELARRAKGEFAFVAVPLRITGATGSPLRPLALV